MRSRLKIGLLLTAVAFVPVTSLADDNCFKVSFSKDEGVVKDLVIDASDRNAIYLTVWDLPETVFISGGICSKVGNRTTCGVECDGGSVNYFGARSGQLFARFDDLSFGYEAPRASILDNHYDADGTTLKGSFLLQKDDDQAECDRLAAGNQDSATFLQAGDISPDVESVETDLTKIGYPIANTNWVFNKALEQKVKDFQTQNGLEATGKIDHRTYSTLVSQAATSGGGGC